MERGEERENGLRLGERDVGDLATEAGVPAEGGTLEAPRLRVAKEERELERVGEADVRKLFRGARAASAFRDSRARRKRAYGCPCEVTNDVRTATRLVKRSV